MSELNPEIQKILDDHNIDPAPKEQWDPAPNRILKDFFESLDDIFRPYEEKNNIKPKGWRKDQQ